MKKVRKAVIAAAGYGTRMLPITKTISKEILPVVDKPIIQIVVEQLVEAGIKDIIIVTAAHKADLVAYFGETEAGLVEHLRHGGKRQLIKELDGVRKLANFAFVEQHGVYGTGTPVLCAEPYLGDEPFIYAYPDNFIVSDENCFKQMIDVYTSHGAPVLGCILADTDEDYNRYGYAGGDVVAPGLIDVRQFVEKPGRAHAPSNLAWPGFALVTPDVLRYLHQLLAELPDGHELFFPLAFSMMVADGRQVMAKQIAGARYFDTGNKLEYMKTVVAMAARHPEIGEDFRRYIVDVARRMQ